MFRRLLLWAEGYTWAEAKAGHLFPATTRVVVEDNGMADILEYLSEINGHLLAIRNVLERDES